MHVHGVNPNNQLAPIKALQPNADFQPTRRTAAVARTTQVAPALPSKPTDPTDPTRGEPPREKANNPPVAPQGTGELTLEGLMAAWGETDSVYDLNGDRIVDTIDLLELLGRMNGDGGGAEQTQGDMPMITVEDLKKAWGETDSVYDLDGSGVVDVNDLLQLLAEGGTMPHPDAPVTVDGLIAAWGQQNEHYDLNGDSVVDMADLLALLGRLDEGDDPGQTQQSTPLGDPGLSDRLAGLKQRYSRHGAERVADRLISRLESAGPEQQRPTAIASLMSQFEMRPTQRQIVMQRLAERFGERSFDRTA